MLVRRRVNLTFDPVVFEDPELGVKVHRGVYAAAQALYDRFLPLVEEHLASSPYAKIMFSVRCSRVHLYPVPKDLLLLCQVKLRAPAQHAGFCCAKPSEQACHLCICAGMSAVKLAPGLTSMLAAGPQPGRLPWRPAHAHVRAPWSPAAPACGACLHVWLARHLC